MVVFINGSILNCIIVVDVTTEYLRLWNESYINEEAYPLSTSAIRSYRVVLNTTLDTGEVAGVWLEKYHTQDCEEMQSSPVEIDLRWDLDSCYDAKEIAMYPNEGSFALRLGKGRKTPKVIPTQEMSIAMNNPAYRNYLSEM